MAGFENCPKDIAEIEFQIVRKGIALGIDWSNKEETRALAHEALNHLSDEVKIVASEPIDHKLRAKIDLFGLAGIMLKIMEESASVGIESHGGPAWKAFTTALWAEAQTSHRETSES
jgi:hypothetical protein